MRIVLKGCPRCGGDLIPEATTIGEPTFLCLQCGRNAPHANGKLFPQAHPPGVARREPAEEPAAVGRRTAA